MKKALWVLAAGTTASLYAAMPFTISGNKIQAIFEEPKIWRSYAGSVESILFKGHTADTSTYYVTTKEHVPVRNDRGFVVGHKTVPCLLEVDVTAKGDELAPKWEVTKIDAAGCPKTP